MIGMSAQFGISDFKPIKAAALYLCPRIQRSWRRQSTRAAAIAKYTIEMGVCLLGTTCLITHLVEIATLSRGFTVQPEKLAAAIDENTIGVGAVLGTTYTGAFEDVATLDTLVGEISLLQQTNDPGEGCGCLRSKKSAVCRDMGDTRCATRAAARTSTGV